MSKMYMGNIDVSKITKSKLYKGKKGTYASVVIWVNDEPDQHGNHISIQESQTKEEIAKNTKKVYLGNFKLFERDGNSGSNQSQPSSGQNEMPDETDDLPF